MGRRLLRFAFTALSALSLALCVASPLGCVQSYRRPFRVTYQSRDPGEPVTTTEYWFSSESGFARFAVSRNVAGSADVAAFLSESEEGFHYEQSDPYDGEIPLWEGTPTPSAFLLTRNSRGAEILRTRTGDF